MSLLSAFSFVCFEHHKDLRRAIEKYQGQEFNGREMELIDDTRW